MVITRKQTPQERLAHTGLSYLRNGIFATVEGYRVAFVVTGGYARTKFAIEDEFPGAVCEDDTVTHLGTGRSILFAELPSEEFDTEVSAVAPDYTK